MLICIWENVWTNVGLRSTNLPSMETELVELFAPMANSPITLPVAAFLSAWWFPQPTSMALEKIGSVSWSVLQGILLKIAQEGASLIVLMTLATLSIGKAKLVCLFALRPRPPNCMRIILHEPVWKSAQLLTMGLIAIPSSELVCLCAVEINFQTLNPASALKFVLKSLICSENSPPKNASQAVIP